MILALLLACAGAPEPPLAATLADCTEASCTAEWLDAHWGEADAIGQISSHPDPVVQLYLLQHLLETRPGEVESLCRAFSEGSDPARRCKKLAGRPHLWDQPVQSAVASGRSCDEKLPALVPDVPLADPWANLAPLELTCPEASTEAGCRTQQAQRLASEQRFDDAARACVGIENPQWRYECAFQVMETGWQRGSHGTPGRAAGACLASGPYLPCCLGHLAKEVGMGAPPADVVAPRRWTALLRQTSALTAAVRPSDPALALRLEQQTLSIAITEAYATANVPASDLAAALPPAVQPLLRAGAALALLQAEGSTHAERSGAEWRKRLDEVLVNRANAKAGKPTRHPSRNLPHHWPWQTRLPSDWQVVPLLDGSRRLVGGDAEADGWIALLEVATDLGLSLPTLVRDAAAHPDPRVRWTAALVATAHGAQGVRRTLADDSDTTVRAAVLDLEDR